MLNEVVDLGLQGARQIVVFQQDAVLQSLMPPLCLAVGLRMVRCTTDISDLPLFQPFSQRIRSVLFIVTEADKIPFKVEVVVEDSMKVRPGVPIGDLLSLA
jgi:hypothetical protein